VPNEVNPIDPMNPTGDGKSPAERMKRGMPNVDPAVQKDFAERLQKYIDQGKEERAARNEYKKVEANTRVGGVGGGGGGGMGVNKLSNRDLTKAYKKGGSVSLASKRADGCCIKGKTKGKIV
jgi:hypothetical protein